MKILYLCHRVPYPPDKGDRIRAFHELRYLGLRHDVHLLTLAGSAAERQAAEGLRKHCRRVEVFPANRYAGYLRALLELATSRPLTLAFYRSRQLGARVRPVAQEEPFDVVVAFSAAMAPYAERVPRIPKVLDMVDVDSSKWAQYAGFTGFPRQRLYELEAQRLRAYEAAVSRRMERVVLATEREVAELRSFAPEAKTVAVRNGVDLLSFHPIDTPRSSRRRLVFTGQMDYFANVQGIVHLARSTFPRLRRRYPDLELVVVGRAPTREVVALGKIPGVRVTGSVEDVRPYLATASIFVAPLKIAQGVQNKVLEAMAMELPAVVTEQVMAGLADGGFQPGRDVLVAAGDGDFEEAVARLLENRELRESMGVEARRRVEEAYSWDRNMAELEEVLRQVAGGAE